MFFTLNHSFWWIRRKRTTTTTEECKSRFYNCWTNDSFHWLTLAHKKRNWEEEDGTLRAESELIPFFLYCTISTAAAVLIANLGLLWSPIVHKLNRNILHTNTINKNPFSGRMVDSHATGRRRRRGGCWAFIEEWASLNYWMLNI